MASALLTDEICAAFAPCRTWPIGVDGQICSTVGVGICDPVLGIIINSLPNVIYDTVFFQWTLSGAGGTLSISAGQTRTFFANAFGGVGGTIDGGWQSAGLEYRDTIDGNVPGCRGFLWMVSQIGFTTHQPFQRGGSQVSAADPEFHPLFLNPADNGNNLNEQLKAVQMEVTAAQLQRSDTGQTAYLGALQLFISAIGAKGQNMVNNGLFVGPGGQPLAGLVGMGSKDDCLRVTIPVVVGQNVSFDAGGATPATVPGTGLAGTVYLPVTCWTYGYYIMYSEDNICDPLSYDDKVVLAQMAAQARANGSVPQLPGK
jgi:hypothetical protein